MRDFLKDAFFVILFVIGAIFAAAVLMFPITWTMQETSFSSSLAQIEQLRHDVQFVDLQASEDVFGQVAQWNQTIKSNQAYNDIFIVGLLIPDGWDEIKLIEIGR